MAKLIKFPGSDMEPDVLLEMAKGKYSQIMIIGDYGDGLEVEFSNKPGENDKRVASKAPDLLWMIARAERMLHEHVDATVDKE